MTERLSAREFAARENCSHTLVNKAVKQGKLHASADGTIDAALVGSGWRKANRRRPKGVETVETQGGNLVETVSSVSTQKVSTVSTDRLSDLTIAREPIAQLNDFESYWLRHTPDAHDLADHLGTTPGQIEAYWETGEMSKGAPLYSQIDQWDDIQAGSVTNGRPWSATMRR